MAKDTALKLALAPVLLAQGLRVRHRALVLPEAAGPRTGTLGEGPPLRLLLVGDSSAAGVGARDQAEALAGRLTTRLAASRLVSWRLIARTGATTASTLDRLMHEAPARFDIAVTALGVNDVAHAVPLARWREQQARLHALLTERFGVSHVVVSGLPPMGAFPALPQPLRYVMGRSARRYDAALAAMFAPNPAAATHVPFTLPLTADLMAEDGFHPGPKGYALWAETLAPAVLAAL